MLRGDLAYLPRSRIVTLYDVTCELDGDEPICSSGSYATTSRRSAPCSGMLRTHLPCRR